MMTTSVTTGGLCATAAATPVAFWVAGNRDLPGWTPLAWFDSRADHDERAACACGFVCRPSRAFALSSTAPFIGAVCVLSTLCEYMSRELGVLS